MPPRRRLRATIDASRTRLDVMNPYVTDHAMVDRILAAARRGVRVRVVVSAKSNNAQASASFRHRYAELQAAGAEVWELPATVVHAKVVVADETVSFGTVNLDAWALYRNSEIAMLAESAVARGSVRGAAVRARHRALGARPAAGGAPRAARGCGLEPPLHRSLSALSVRHRRRARPNHPARVAA